MPENNRFVDTVAFLRNLTAAKMYLFEVRRVLRICLSDIKEPFPHRLIWQCHKGKMAPNYSGNIGVQ